MDRLFLGIIIGIAAGIIDIIPMIVQKLDKKAIISAFLQYFFMAIIIVNIDLPHIVWWLEGGTIALMMAVPIVLIISATNKESAPNFLTMSVFRTIFIILGMSVILGTLIGIAGHYL
jgi:hypothetical protein